jgi:hypothetical protein
MRSFGRPQIDRDQLVSRLSSLTGPKPAAAPAPEPARIKEPRKRREAREPTFRFARIFIGRQPSQSCIVRDISPSGARIAMDGAAELPEQVILAISQDARKYRARVAWRKEHEAGLCFLGEIAALPETKPG